MKPFQAVVVLLAVAVWTPTASGETYVVRPDRQGDYPTIQDAIYNSTSGDVIELTDGLFAGNGNREIDFEGRAITIRSQSGNPETCVIDIEGTESEPRRGFLFRNGEGPGSVIEGVTITGGWIGAPECGGAIKIGSDSSPTINNCRIVDNYADCIGGIFVQNGSPTLIECVFEGNSSAPFGECGALFIGWESSSILTRCQFLGNSSGTGGGLFFRFGADVRLVDCLFAGNTAGLGGAVYCEDDAIVTFENCTFVGNTATTDGAGIFCRDNAMVTLTNTIIASGTDGGAIVCEDAASASLTCCSVFGNTGGDWEGCIADQAGVDGNLALDPCFCLDSYYIAETSPCAAGNNSCGVMIGAFGTGCIDCGGEVPVLETTWGQLKAGYR